MLPSEMPSVYCCALTEAAAHGAVAQSMPKITIATRALPLAHGCMTMWWVERPWSDGVAIVAPRNVN